MRKGVEVRLGLGDRERLEAIVGSRNSPQKHVWRARIVLLSAAGVGTMAIQRQTAKGKPTIWRWQARFMDEGVDGLLHDATRPAGKPPLPAATIERVVEMTLAEPPGEAMHWTGRAMAKAAGVSHRSVQRIWTAHGLKPHRVKTFKLSTDPKFAAKVQDVVGLYVDPPEHALVLSVDEKSQIQALDRTQPGLPMKKGRCGTMTHDYKRHGTTTLFAALDVLDGRVIGQCMARHRHQEFIRFLNKINRETPAERELHLIVDNYATHKHPKVRAWLERHPRFHFHFTPTSASWLNAVEGFFAKLTRQRLKRGVFKGIVDLQAAINRYLAETNDNPRRFTWTADPDAIIEKVRRGKEALNTIGLAR
jgi:transposase